MKPREQYCIDQHTALVSAAAVGVVVVPKIGSCSGFWTLKFSINIPRISLDYARISEVYIVCMYRVMLVAALANSTTTWRKLKRNGTVVVTGHLLVTCVGDVEGEREVF
jgi:hypothetical protein